MRLFLNFFFSFIPTVYDNVILSPTRHERNRENYKLWREKVFNEFDKRSPDDVLSTDVRSRCRIVPSADMVLTMRIKEKGQFIIGWKNIIYLCRSAEFCTAVSVNCGICP